jgi:hypothetical protein
MSIIDWDPKARDQLSDIYVRITREERDELVKAVDEVENHLHDHRGFAGEQRTKYGRVYIHPLLVVFFTAFPDAPLRSVGVRPNRPFRPRPRT